MQSSCNVLGEGLNSDFLTVELMPSTLPHLQLSSSLPFDNNPLNFPVSQEFCDYRGYFGLFTVGAERGGAVLCVFRGNIIPMDDIYHFSTIPIVQSPGGEIYPLEPMSVCNMVNDCFDPISGSFAIGCSYNAQIKYVHGQIMLVATEDIPPNQEIFVNFGSHYWKQKASNYLVSNISMHSRMPLNLPLPVSARWSEYISLYKAPSLLPVPNIGLGLFAKFDIPVGTIICEYRGENSYYYPSKMKSDKWSHIVDSRDRQWISMGVCPCACSNDAAHIVGRTYSSKEYSSIFLDQSVGNYTSTPKIPGFSFNSWRGNTFTGNVKSFIVSIKDISAGAEILNHFGISYWSPRLIIKEEN